ncbi:MAG: hypothetical protein P1V81_16920, partial [Planctomycetota bacterium]|nr:hypothetical protein [Planctomycetota bacterium]
MDAVTPLDFRQPRNTSRPKAAALGLLLLALAGGCGGSPVEATVEATAPAPPAPEVDRNLERGTPAPAPDLLAR